MAVRLVTRAEKESSQTRKEMIEAIDRLRAAAEKREVVSFAFVMVMPNGDSGTQYGGEGITTLLGAIEWLKKRILVDDD